MVGSSTMYFVPDWSREDSDQHVNLWVLAKVLIDCTDVGSEQSPLLGTNSQTVLFQGKGPIYQSGAVIVKYGLTIGSDIANSCYNIAFSGYQFPW